LKLKGKKYKKIEKQFKAKSIALLCLAVRSKSRGGIFLSVRA
jgi:hypothetical protein